MSRDETPKALQSLNGSTTTNALGGKQSYIGVRYDLIPAFPLEELAKVLHHGAEKYGVDNWRLIDSRDHVNHALAHLVSWLKGDPEDQSSEDHLTHAACRCLFAKELDDQWPNDFLDDERPQDPLPPSNDPKETPLRIFVSGPYSAATREEILHNIYRADITGRLLLAKGHHVFVPHTMTWGWESVTSYNEILYMDLVMLSTWANAVFSLGSSPGADLELKVATHLGYPVFTDFDDVPYVKSSFRETIDRNLQEIRKGDLRNIQGWPRSPK